MTTHSSLTNEALNWGQSPIISGPPETGHPTSNLREAVLASRSNSRDAVLAPQSNLRDAVWASRSNLREAKKRLTATVPKSNFGSTYSKRATYKNPNRNKFGLLESVDRIRPLTTVHWTLITQFLIDRPEIRIVFKPLKTNDNTNSNRPNSRGTRESSGARRGREGGHKYQILIGPGDD
jgi:hypothetical protein